MGHKVLMTAAAAAIADGPRQYTDPLDDVFGSAPPSPTQDALESESRPQNADPSDVPRLRSIHVTNGYREGVAASKEKYVQEGFDEGYSLGAELGMKAGWCLGALEGIWHALQGRKRSGEVEEEQQDGEEVLDRETVRGLLMNAEEELTVQSLFGQGYFGPDGIWLYDVPSTEGEEDVTFGEVADAHPVLRKWIALATEMAEQAGLDVGIRAKK